MNNSTFRLQATAIYLAYDSVDILRGVDVELRSNDIKVIIGENGSGKTTLLDVLFGFAKPQKGKIRIDGLPLHATPENCSNAGIVRTFQKPRVFEQLSVKECLMVAVHGGKFPLPWINVLRTKAFREEEKNCEKKCYEMLERMGWKEMWNNEAGSLSYGQRKLLVVCQAFLSPASIMILDEPIAGLDERQRQFVINLLAEWVKQNENHCILATTHEIPVFRKIATKILRLSAGMIQNEA